MSDLVKVKAYYVVRRDSVHNSFSMYAGPYDYYRAVKRRDNLREGSDEYLYEIIYTDIVGELLG